MLNVDTKIISKVLSEKLKDVLPDLISSQQTAYIKNSHIGESGRLISNIIEITEIKNIEGFLAQKKLKKLLLISTLEKYGFRQNFILWVKILLKGQESCATNGGKTTKYFLLGRNGRQGYPISALEILFLLIKTKPEIPGLTIFCHCYIYSACPDDITFS